MLRLLRGAPKALCCGHLDCLQHMRCAAALASRLIGGWRDARGVRGRPVAGRQGLTYQITDKAR